MYSTVITEPLQDLWFISTVQWSVCNPPPIIRPGLQKQIIYVHVLCSNLVSPPTSPIHHKSGIPKCGRLERFHCTYVRTVRTTQGIGWLHTTQGIGWLHTTQGIGWLHTTQGIGPLQTNYSETSLIATVGNASFVVNWWDWRINDVWTPYIHVHTYVLLVFGD
jgi:hypothetical protein